MGCVGEFEPVRLEGVSGGGGGFVEEVFGSGLVEGSGVAVEGCAGFDGVGCEGEAEVGFVAGSDAVLG